MEAELERVERKHGGARKGAGFPLGQKKRKTIAKEAATMYLIRRIEENIEPLATALIDKALTGDTTALKESFERGLGKVKETHDLNVRVQPPLDEVIEDNRLQADQEPQ